MKKFIIIIGPSIILIGFLYDFIFVGIPSQDAPIPVIVHQVQQQKTADIIKRVGLVVFMVGLVFSLISYMRKNYKK